MQACTGADPAGRKPLCQGGGGDADLVKKQYRSRFFVTVELYIGQFKQSLQCGTVEHLLMRGNGTVGLLDK